MAQTKYGFSGMWIFGGHVSTQELADFAAHWAEHEPRYHHIYIRHLTDGTMAIGFTYQPAKLNEGYEQYLHQSIRSLKQTFADRFVGWDICSRALVIK